MEKTLNSDRVYFQNLDVIRFIAAFMVVLVHAYEAWCGWYGQIGILSNGTYKDLSFGGKFVSDKSRSFSTLSNVAGLDYAVFPWPGLSIGYSFK
jgi:hypothetical protein